ncbi:unnamed protein product [Peniophora sp. CBMAI 1063]|nr:unnamed protein product [Peniophora sp. CBMAI 1063]
MMRPLASHSGIRTLLRVLLAVGAVRCQDFNIPQSWRKPTSSLSLAQRVSLASNAISPLVTSINPSNGTNYELNTWQSAGLLASIAQLDYVSGAQNNHELVQQSVSAFQSSHLAFFDSQLPRNVTSDPLMWGLAAYYGARAYNDTVLLDTSKSIWSSVQTYVVSAQNGASGTQATKNGTFSASCLSNSNYTSAGAVFWQATIPNNYMSNAETVGAYVALSAHLWEATRDTEYLDSAAQSAQFMYNYLYSNELQIIWDTFDLKACTVSQLNWTYNQGFLMEGLSILSSAPVISNTTWTSLLRTLVSSTTLFPAWTSPNGTNAGVLIEASNINPRVNSVLFDYRNVFINALLEIWARIPSNDPMAAFIEAFVIVQFNALQDLAYNHDTYSPVWTGPQLPQMVPWGQLAAIPVLSAAIKMAPSPTSNGTATSTPSSPAATSGAASSSSGSLSGGAIAGIVIGAGGVLALVAASVILVRRHKRQRASEENEQQAAVQPFMPSAVYRQPAGTAESVRQLPADYSRKDRHGYGSGQRYVGSPLLTVPDSEEPPSALPTGGQATSTDFLYEVIEQVMDRMRGREEPPAYTGQ